VEPESSLGSVTTELRLPGLEALKSDPSSACHRIASGMARVVKALGKPSLVRTSRSSTGPWLTW
jgi:hypothetical protein